ncbi:QacE family quaternary ammonium compound efflux SMR transporter [Kushneria pakistanensis]|uniref:QacE family quaternary ammonium compound efflux SMR transporter n=1 Tax=Kushneria pakistanensis TaxID=1508770 RepID=A0ABQ3FK82_9GAMM|nr:multidrug efflux SMR transporter [Kushneria pakistanensis]GHC26967.1 QacE family quaternary ammonium compound efflux SMR transporter [Kushneria pakistanensis]
MSWHPYLYLILAICAEVIATNALKASNAFSRLGPSLLTVVGYGIAFYLLSLVLKSMPVGVAYAIWAGLGMVLTLLVAMVAFGERPDMPAMLGIALIVAGVVVLQCFSKMNAQ